MRPGTAAGADGKWNEWCSIRLPDDFDRVYSGALSPGEYWATWSRSHGLGPQVLRRITFQIDKYGSFSMLWKAPTDRLVDIAELLEVSKQRAHQIRFPYAHAIRGRQRELARAIGEALE